MAVKTFGTEVLTSADTNTYLNNGGLVYITEEALNSGSAVNIANCFSSTYDNYRITTQFTRSVAGSGYCFLYLGTTGANHVMSGQYMAWNNGTRNGDSGSASYCYFTGQGQNAGVSDVFSPNLAQYSYITNSGNSPDYASATSVRVADTTQYTGLGFSIAVGAFTSGKITVYGYRKA